MRVKCNNCSKSFKIDPSKITKPRQKVKCPACGQAILISKPDPASFGELSLDLSTDDISGFKQLDLDRLHDGFQPSDSDADSSIWGEPAGSSDSNPVGLSFDGQDLGLFDRLNPDQLDSALGDTTSDYHQAAFESNLSLEIGDTNPEIVDEGVEAQSPEKAAVTTKAAVPESVVAIGLIQIKGKLSVCLRCPDCQAASRIEYKKIPDEGLTAKCKKCGGKLPIKRPSYPGPAWEKRQKGEQYEVYGWPEIYFRAMGLIEDQTETPAPEPEPVSETTPASVEIRVDVPPDRQVAAPPRVSEAKEPPASKSVEQIREVADVVFEEPAAPVAPPEPLPVDAAPAETVLSEIPESRLEQVIPSTIEEPMLAAVIAIELPPAENAVPEPSPPEISVAPEEEAAVETEAPPLLEALGPEPSIAPEEPVAPEEPKPSETVEAGMTEFMAQESPATGEAEEIPLMMEAGPSEPFAPVAPVFDSLPEEAGIPEVVPPPAEEWATPAEAAPVIEEAPASETLAPEPEPLEEAPLPEPVVPEPMSMPETIEAPIETFPEPPVLVEAAMEPQAAEPEPTAVQESQEAEPASDLEAQAPVPIAEFVPSLETASAEPAALTEAPVQEIVLPEEAPTAAGLETAFTEAIEAVASPTTEIAVDDAPAESMIHAQAPHTGPESPPEPLSKDEPVEIEAAAVPAETSPMVEEPAVPEAIEEPAIPDAPDIEALESPMGEAMASFSIPEAPPAEVETGRDTVPAQLDLFGEPLVAAPVESPVAPETESPSVPEAVTPTFEMPLLAALLAAEEFQATQEPEAVVAGEPSLAEVPSPALVEVAPWEPPQAVDSVSPALEAELPEIVQPEILAPEAIPIAFVSEPAQAETAPEIEQAAETEPTPEPRPPAEAHLPEPPRTDEPLAHLKAEAVEEPAIQVETAPVEASPGPAPIPTEPTPLQSEAVVTPPVVPVFEPVSAPVAAASGIVILEEESAVLAGVVEAPEDSDGGSGIDLAAVAGIKPEMLASAASSAPSEPVKAETASTDASEPEYEISLADVFEEAEREPVAAPELPVSQPAGKPGADKSRPQKVVSLEPSAKAKAKKEAVPAPAAAEPVKPQFRYVEEPRVKKGSVVKIVGVLVLLGIVGGLVYFLPSYFSDMKIRNERQAALTAYEPLKFLADAIAGKQEYAEYSTGVIKAEMTLKKKESEFAKQDQLVEIYSLYKLADQMWESVLYKDADQLSKAFEQACVKAREIEKGDTGPETAALIAAARSGCDPGVFQDVFKDPNPSRARQLQWVDAAKQLLWRQAAQRLARFEKEVLTPK